MPTLLRIVSVLGLCLAGPTSAALAVVPPSASDIIERIDAARRRLEQRQIEFEASGGWTRLGRDNKSVANASFHVWASTAGRFCLEISDKADAVHRRLLVTDGDSLVAAEFSPRIRPSGCAINVYDCSRDSLLSASGGLGVNPVSMHFSTAPSKRYFESAEAVDVATGPAGILLVTVRYSDAAKALPAEMVVETSEAIEFNVSRVSTKLRGIEHPVSVKSVQWERVSDEWFVRSYQFEQFDALGARFDFTEVKLDEVMVSERHDPEKFSLKTFDGCDATRIVDRRNDRSRPFLRPAEKPKSGADPNDE